MPNDNLGRAEGTIRLNLEDQASGKLLATLTKLSRQFDEMNKRLGRIEKTLKSTDDTFDRTSKTIDSTAKSTKKFGESIFAANKNVSRLSRDVTELYENFTKFATVLERVGRVYRPLSQTYRVLDLMQRLRFDAAANSLQRFNRALSGAGVYNNLWERTGKGLLGINRAISEMPVWTQNLNRFVGKLAQVGTVAFGIERLARTNPFGKLLDTKMFARIAASSEGAGLAIQSFTNRSNNGLNSFARSVQNVAKPIANFSNGVKGIVTGAALMISGIQDVIEKFAFLRAIPTPILKGLALMISNTLPVALSVLSKALTATSNVLLGLLDGVKQLSGGLLVLPGIIASIGVIATSLLPVFKGLGDKFKDIFSDDYTKRWEAMAALPAHLRPLGQALVKISDKFKVIQATLQTVAFDKVEQQISKLAEGYLPLFERGATKVITAIRGLKDEFVAFLGTQQTMTDLSTMYARVAEGIANIKSAVQPALSGLRDIAVVGVGFLRDMTAMLPTLIGQFAEWASANRSNGNLLKWMQDARAGVYDLIRGTVSLTKGLWAMLTVFRSNQGGDGLERFANSMERFNQAVQRSAAVGTLRNIGEAVREMSDPGGNKMKDFVGTMHDFGEMVKAVWQVVKGTADAFSAQFLPALRQFMQFITLMANLKHSLGLDEVAGRLLGLWAAFKLGDRVLHGVFGGIKAVAGAFMLLRNSSKIVSAVDTAFLKVAGTLDNFGSVGKKASTSMMNVHKSISGILPAVGAIGGSIAGVLLAVGAGWLMWDERNKVVKGGLDQITTSAQHTKDAGNAMKEAFIDDGGLVGRTVMDSITQSLDTMFSDLESQSQKAPGMMAHIGDSIRDAFTMDEGESLSDFLLGDGKIADSDALNQVQKAAADAERAQENFKKAGVTQDDLKRAVMGSADSYQYLRHRLADAGSGFNEAIAQVDALREQFQQAEAAAKELGDGGIEVAAGVRKIAEAGGDAVSKLEGLKQVLEGLGILKTSSLEAAFAYEEGIRNLGEAVADAASKGLNFSDAIDPITGGFNKSSESAKALFDILQPLGDQFMATANANGNTQEAYAKFQEQLVQLEATTGLTQEKLLGLAHDVGIVPNEVNIALQLSGADTMTQDIVTAFLEAQKRAGEQGPIQIPVGVQNDPQAVADQINQIVGRAVATTGEKGNILLKPGLSQADLSKIQQDLANRGISTPGYNAKPATLNLQVNSPGIGNALGKDEKTLEQERQNVKSSLDGILGDIAGVTDQAAETGKDAGSKFVDEYAAGIGGNTAARDAARRMAEDILKQFHQSPPKEGPLKRHGDAAKYGGEMFTTQYASGIVSQQAQVGSAASRVAGAASSGLKGDKMYETGKFLGQISSIVDFASNLVDTFTKVAETVLSVAKFASDPMGKGTFFGQQRAFKRDPAISDTDLAKTRADNAQQRMFSFYGSGQRPDLYDPSTGQLRGPNVGDLSPGAGKQDLANYIIDKAMSQGYTREQANKFLVQAVGESGLDPTSSNPAGWEGIFQFDAQTWKSAGGGDVRNPQQNIDNYFKLAEQRGLTPQNFKSGEQLGEQVSIGGPWHPENQAKYDALNKALSAAAPFIGAYQSGVGQSTSGGVVPGVPAMLGNLKGSKLRPGEGVEAGLAPAAATVAALLSNMFPGITDIGGRQERSGPQMHPKGRALDVMTGGDAALGDKIAQFVKANYASLGIQSFIWRDTGLNLVANEGGGPGTTYTAGGHGGPTGTNQGSHVHIQFADHAELTSTPSGTDIKVPVNSPFKDLNYGLPLTPEQMKDAAPPARDSVVRNADGTFTPVHGTGDKPGPDQPINPLTGLPYTDAESAEFWNRPENAIQYDRNQLQPGDDQIPGLFQGNQDDLLNEVKTQTPLLQGILDGTNTQLTESEAINAATQLQTEIDKQTALDTPASRARASALSGIQSQITSDYGLTQEENPIDKASSMVSSVSGIAGDIFKVINSGIEAIGATKDITETLVRYPSNTEDIFRMIDDFQKYIKLAADIAGATSSILGAIGSMSPSGMDMGAGAAIKGASQVAAMVQAALETVNAVIDLGQEAYRLIGTYVGDFLGFLVGGQDSLRGNIKFLLDTQNNELLAYSQDNPLDKRVHEGVGGSRDTRGQLARDIYVYGGPGQDPRDNTRQMMLQIKMNQMATATAG